MVPFGVCSGDYDNYTCTCNAGFDSPYNPDGSVIDTICNGKSEFFFFTKTTCNFPDEFHFRETLNNFREMVLD